MISQLIVFTLEVMKAQITSKLKVIIPLAISITIGFFVAVEQKLDLSSMACQGIEDRKTYQSQIDLRDLNGPMDAFLIGLSSAKAQDGLLISSLSMQDKLKKSKILLYKFKDSFELEALPLPQQPSGGAFHARHAISISLGQGKNGILISDHGPDQIPFEGAIPILLVKNGQTGQWIDESSSRLPQEKAFTYHVGKFDLEGDGVDEIVMGNIINLGKAPEILKLNANGIFSRKIELPKEFTDRSVCVMSVLPFRRFLNQETNESVFFGGCEADPEKNSVQQTDFILKVSAEPFLLESETLPLRQKDSTWGTAHAVAADLNQDGRTDLILATHNLGFTDGQIQILIQTADSQLRFRDETEKLIGNPYYKGSFVPWLAVGDVNLDGVDDFAFTLRPNPHVELAQPVKIFLSQRDKGFSDVSKCLKPKAGYAVAVVSQDFNQDRKDDLMILYSNGQYTIYY